MKTAIVTGASSGIVLGLVEVYLKKVATLWQTLEPRSVYSVIGTQRVGNLSFRASLFVSAQVSCLTLF